MSKGAGFHARSVSARKENGVVVVGFADDEVAPKEYLLIQRTLVPSPQDVCLNQDRVYIERNDQRQSCYGGVVRCVLFEDRIEVRLENSAAEKTGGHDQLNVSFEVTHEQLQALRDMMRLLLEGHATFQDATDTPA